MNRTISFILVSTGMPAIFLIMAPIFLFAPIPMNLWGVGLLNGTAPSPPIDETNGCESFSIRNRTEQMEVSGRSLPVLCSEDASTSAKNKSGSCDGDLYRGQWVYDRAGPLYRNSSCPIIPPSQNCRRNGRPGGDYENWRWQPDLCDLPRFDAGKFLELMKGKTLVFAGDSLSRNQMESLICILWQAINQPLPSINTPFGGGFQESMAMLDSLVMKVSSLLFQVEVPRNLRKRDIHRWHFRSTSTTIVRISSPWLVHRSTGPVGSVPDKVAKLHLDALDETVMELLPEVDVVVLSFGHWFVKQSAYILNDRVVGGQQWWPDKSRKMQVDNVEAFRVSMETVLSAVATHPNFTGLAIFRSISPSHFEGGDWNTGGSCTGLSGPSSESITTGFEGKIYKLQVARFKKAAEAAKNNRSRLRLMDTTHAFGYRRDGHPGPYRSLNPSNNFKPPGHQDCLHWCLPGPVDTLNEILMEIIRREFEGACKKPAQ